MDLDSEKNLNRLITRAYSRNLQSSELVSFKKAIRLARNYGFPFVCSLDNETEAKKIHWAASFLVEIAGSWPQEDMPELLTPVLDSYLDIDARRLLAIGLEARDKFYSS